MPDVLYKNNLPTITGTADDDASSASLPGASKTVYFRIKRNPSAQYFVAVSSSYVADPGGSVNCVSVIDNTCLPATSGSGLNYTFTHSSFTTGNAWESDKTYTIYMVVIDRAGNSFTTTGTNFTWDTTAPNSGNSTRPTAFSPINNLPTLSGTASDGYAVYATSVSLMSLKNNKCYDPGTNFFTANCPFWVNTSSDVSANWFYTDPSIGNRLSTDNTYYVMLSKAIDVARNEQTSFVGGVSSITFMSDTVPPDTTITFPVHNASYRGSQVSGGANPFTGTITDPGAPWNSGVRRAQLRLSYLLAADTWYWDGVSAFSSGTAVSNGGWLNASDTNWNYFGAITWRGVDSQYTMEVRGEDASYRYDGTATGNISTPTISGTNVIQFTIDSTPPTLALTTPSSSRINGLGTISGTANATLSGLNRVEMQISTGTSYYWTGSSWTTTQTWLLPSLLSQTTWSYTVPSAMVADATYTVISRAYDNAGQYSSIYSTMVFTVDLTTPTVSVTSPLNSGTYSHVNFSTPPITGTAADAGSFATGLSTVTFDLRDITAGTYFNGALFVGGGPFYVGINGGSMSSWQFNAGGLSFTNDHQYTLQARATDAAGNYGDSSLVTFQYDIEIPTSSVTSPTPGYVTSLPTILGTATDERFGVRAFEAKLGTYTVGVAIYDINAGLWWDTSSFGSLTPTYVQVINSTITNTTTWSYTVPGGLTSSLVDGHAYQIVPRAVDLAGNAEFAASTAPPGVGIAFIYDAGAPTLTITNPNDATPADDTQPRLSTVGTIIGTPSDASGTGVNLVQLRIYKSDPAKYWSYGSDYSPSAYTIDPTLADTAWFNAITTNSWATWNATFTFLTDYKYHIEARARDLAGNYSVVFATASFLFDQNIPQSVVSFPPTGSVVKAMTQIVGTVAETGSRYPGTASPVHIAIQRLSDGKWWDNNSQTFTLGAAPTSDNVNIWPSSWTFTGIIDSNLNSGTSYYVTTRALDNAVPINDEGYYHSGASTFTFDNTAPLLAMQSPLNNSFINNIAALTISGTATDASSGVATVQVQIQSGGNYWTGTNNGSGNFTVIQTTVTASYSNPTWQFVIPQVNVAGNFVHGQTYAIQARAWDVAGTT